MKKRRRKWRLGDIIECQTKRQMVGLIKELGGRGIDVKPTGNAFQLEVVDLDKKCK